MPKIKLGPSRAKKFRYKRLHMIRKGQTPYIVYSLHRRRHRKRGDITNPAPPHPDPVPPQD